MFETNKGMPSGLVQSSFRICITIFNSSAFIGFINEVLLFFLFELYVFLYKLASDAAAVRFAGAGDAFLWGIMNGLWLEATELFLDIFNFVLLSTPREWEGLE